MDIAHHWSQVGILIHHNGLVAPPKKSTVTAMNTVKSLSVESIQMSHDAREISLRGTQTDVIVIPHKTIGKEFNSPTLMDFTNGFKKGFVILVIVKDVLSSASTIHNVIDGSGILNSQRPRHN